MSDVVFSMIVSRLDCFIRLKFPCLTGCQNLLSISCLRRHLPNATAWVKKFSEKEFEKQGGRAKLHSLMLLLYKQM